MANVPPNLAWQRSLAILAGTTVSVVVIVCLYWAQAIFIPLAMALFLSFLLAPLVTALQRCGLRRAPSVIVVVLFAGVVLSGTIWMITAQVASLMDELPTYSENIKGKIQSLQQLSEGSSMKRLTSFLHEISGEFQSPPPTSPPGAAGLPADAGADRTQPTPVIVRPETTPWLSWVPKFIAPLAESLGGSALAIVLVVFMLLKREDLRNRLIRLIGHGRITVMTKAIEEAGQRISRFLFMQAIVNGTYGAILAGGLAMIGVRYALLWGFLTAVLRYVPYLGTAIATLLPIVLSLAQFEGWTEPLLVIGLFLVLELIAYNIVEPWLFGQSMGVSEVALLVAAAFWAFMWGPIGMVLSSPLTVCLVVLGKYVPQLNFLDVLLGDEAALDPKVSFYQRLLAHDQDEAMDLVQSRAQVSADAADHVFDELLIPALQFASKDREQASLSDADEQFILGSIREIVEELGEDRVEAAAANRSEAAPLRRTRPLILGYPARDAGDRLALLMLAQLLDADRWEIEIGSDDTLAGEFLSQVAEREPALICLAALPPGGLAHTRYLCKRLRARFPDVKIVVGRWGLEEDVPQNRDQLQQAGADLVTTTLWETRNQLRTWLPVLAHDQGESAVRRDEPEPVGVV